MILLSALEFIEKELNKYLTLKLGASQVSYTVIGNISIIHDSTSMGLTDLSNKVVISLINIEEDRISKNPDTATRTLTGITYKNPKVHLNLFLLFSANKNEYSEALKNLSYVIQFFQLNNVFDANSFPDFPEQIEKLIPDLVSLSLEQLNQLWGVLGGKHIPSVMYKMRMVTVEEGMTRAEGGIIKEIILEENNIIN